MTQKNMSGMSLIAVQVLIPALMNGPAFLDRLPHYTSGLFVGLASFCFFSENSAGALLRRYSVPIGKEKPPSSLAAPLLVLNFFLSSWLSQFGG